MTGRVVCVCAALLLASATAVAGLAPTAFADGWVLPSTPLAPLAANVTDQSVAIGASGDAAAVWSDGTSVLVARRPAGGSWSTPVGLGTTMAVQEPSVGVDGSGNVTVVWASSDDNVNFTTWAARYDASTGAWSSPQPLASTGSTVPGAVQVRVNGAGTAVAAWLAQDPVSFNDIVWGAVESGDGTWSAPVQLSDSADSALDTGRPQVALDAGGDAVVAWTAIGADTDFHVRQKLLTGGSWSDGPDIDSSAHRLTPVELDGEAGGAAIAAWLDQVDPASPPTLRASARSAGTWSVPADLSTDVPLTCPTPPVVGEAADGSGDAAVVWRTLSSDRFAAERFVAGAWSALPDIYTPSPTETVDGLALAGDIAAFTVSDSINAYRVLASRWSASGWSSPATLATADAPNSLSLLPSGATNASGDALAGWQDFDSLGSATVDTAGFQATAPALASVTVPPSDTAGTQLTVSATARSVFAVLGQPVWDFGDGTSDAVGASVTHTYAQAGTYTVTVTVTDDVGNHSTTTRQVVVAAAPVGPGPTPAPTPQPTPTPTPKQPALKLPLLGTHGGLLRLAHGSRTVTVVLRSRDTVTLSGLATLTTVAAHRRPPVTLASQRGISVNGGGRVTLKLRLSDAALRRLRSAAKHASPVRLSVRLRTPDRRLETIVGTYTLDGSALYAPIPPRKLSHGLRRRALARIAC